MKKKDYEEELDDEIIDDEGFLDDEEIEDEEIDEDDFIEDEEEYDDEEEETPKKSKKKSSKKPMKKGTKIAIISSSVVAGVVAIVLVLIFAVLPILGIDLFEKAQSGDLADSVDFTKKLTGFAENPNSVTSKTDIAKALVYKESDMAAFYSSTKDKNLVAAQMIFASYMNLAKGHQYSYFKNQVGTTNLGENSGTLIVQRMRRQTQEFKDDTTLKIPYNHNFPSAASAVVSCKGKTSIRYVKNGKIYRIIAKAPKYDSKSGFITCDSWGKGEKYGNSEKISDSCNVTETRMNYLSLVEGMNLDNTYDMSKMKIDKPKAIFKKSTAKIEDKGDYYEIYVEVDPEVANKDADTMAFFNQDNSTTGNSANIVKCNITIQIWKCGLIKAYTVDEEWSGKVGASIISYEGTATAKSDCKYSYTDEDCKDDSITKAIWESL